MLRYNILIIKLHSTRWGASLWQCHVPVVHSGS